MESYINPKTPSSFPCSRGSPAQIIRLVLVTTVENIETETLGVKHKSVLRARLLELSSNQSSVLDLLELYVGLVLLDGLSNQLSRAGLTLCLDNHGLLLLACLVDNEGGSLGLLLGNLLGLNGGCEFGREGEVLLCVSYTLLMEHTVVGAYS